MYNTIFSYKGLVKGTPIMFFFIPDFRQDIAHEGYGEFTSDKPIVIHDGLVYADEEAQWFCVKDKFFYNYYVTGKTREVFTHNGDMNEELNLLLREARKEYYDAKQEEVRVYYYDAYKKCLKNPIGCDIHSLKNPYKYDISRKNVNKQFIDRVYRTPENDCFLLGRVVKTVGDRDGDLVDFIEPIAIVPFETDLADFWSYKDFLYERKRLYYCITELYGFTVKKEYNPESLEANRVKTYLKNNNISGGYPKGFIQEIKDAFINGDMSELASLYNALNTPQDCRRVCFEIVIPKDECNKFFTADEKIKIRYDNHEIAWETVSNIYESRDYCRNASLFYLGSLRKVYQFNML